MATQVSEARKDELRAKHNQDVEKEAKKQRFGLFGQPPPLCAGENTYHKPKFADKDEDGKVKLREKNFNTAPMKKGAIDGCLFSKPGYVTQGDLFHDAGTLKMRDAGQGPFSKDLHEKQFKPGGPVKQKHLPYEHAAEGQRMRLSRRDEDGKVITAERNFLTCPVKQGKAGKGTLLSSMPYEPDVYEIHREIAKDERIKHHEKMQDKPFRNMIGKHDPFFNFKQTYGGNELVPPKTEKAVEEKEPLHDKPFKPSHPAKQGHNKTLAPFPQYKEQTVHKVFTIKKKGADDAPESATWKPTHNNKTKPCNSVATNQKNLKTEFPRHFMGQTIIHFERSILPYRLISYYLHNASLLDSLNLSIFT